MEFLDANSKLVLAPEPRWFHSPKRVRALLNGTAVVDTRDAHLLREGGPPVYYFPLESIKAGVLEPSTTTRDVTGKGNATYYNVRVGDRIAEDAAWSFQDPPAETAFIRDYVVLAWKAMDTWLEEDDEVFVHPRDPFKRIECFQTSRHVQVDVGGQTVADTTRAVVLLEPGHPIRYYIPKIDVRMDLLVSSSTLSRCAYKGEASYYTVGSIEDAAWTYSYPTAEVAKVVGMVCFFDERADCVVVDGEVQAKPATGWSR